MRAPTTPPLLLALSLALAACGDDAATAPAGAAPPVLEVLAPAPGDSVVPAGPVLVRARCREEDGRGCMVEVFLQGARVAGGTDSVNALVPVPEGAGGLRFTFVASSRDGGSATAESGAFRVVSSRWVPMVTTPDFLLDAVKERALYLIAGIDQMRILNTRTGEDRIIAMHSTWSNVRGPHVLTAAGAVVDYGPPFEFGGKASGIREFGGSNGGDIYATGAMARGRWAAWRTYSAVPALHRDDVLSASLTNTPDSLEADEPYDLAENGTVVFTGRPQDFDDDNAESRLYLWRGTVVTLRTPDPAVQAFWPLTDGTGVVYAQARPAADGEEHRIVYIGPGGEEVLAPLSGPPSRNEERYNLPYQISNGWVAYHDEGRLWVRTPSGERREVLPAAGTLTLLSLGPAGEVLAREGGTDRLLLISAPHTRATVVTFDGLGSFKWVDARLYGFTDRTMYRLASTVP
jgi:hypothetical protein